MFRSKNLENERYQAVGALQAFGSAFDFVEPATSAIYSGDIDARNLATYIENACFTCNAAGSSTQQTLDNCSQNGELKTCPSGADVCQIEVRRRDTKVVSLSTFCSSELV